MESCCETVADAKLSDEMRLQRNPLSQLTTKLIPLPVRLPQNLFIRRLVLFSLRPRTRLQWRISSQWLQLICGGNLPGFSWSWWTSLGPLSVERHAPGSLPEPQTNEPNGSAGGGPWFYQGLGGPLVALGSSVRSEMSATPNGGDHLNSLVPSVPLFSNTRLMHS